MLGDPENVGSARAGIRRGARRQRERERELTMRHRWYAGGIAALLSGALVFTGVMPASADAAPPPSDTAASASAEEAPAEETPAEETPAEEAPAEEAPAEEAPAEETPAEETPAEETPAEETPAEPAPTTPAPAPSSPAKPGTGKSAAPEQNAVVAPLAVIPGCTQSCSTIIRNVSISGGGPASVTDWEYRANAGGDWYVLPSGGTGINVARQAYVISAVSLNANTANYTTSVDCSDPGQGVNWNDGTSTLTFSGGQQRTSTCTFVHTYSAPQQATVTVKVGSDRTGVTGVTNLGGVVLHLRSDNGSGSGPSTARADGVAGDGAGWARCVSDATTGDCVFTVPGTQPGGANAGTRPWVVQYSAPAGYYLNPNLRTGGASGSGDSTAYRFRLKTGLSGSTAYSSGNAAQLMLSSGTEANASGGIWQQSRTNPSLTPSCGLDVSLILDISGSVGDALPNLKSAANTFVDALVGTPSRMSLFSFSWESPGSEASQNYPNLTPVTTPAQGTGFKNRYASWGSDGGTNWDRGLGEAASANTGANKFDVAVIITDGNPTTYNDPYQGSGTNNRFRETENGIFSANAIKASGTRLLAFGVGAGATGATNSLNLRAISGPTAYNGSNGAAADFYQTADYAAVGTALRNLALGNCAGSLNVTKMIVPSTAPAGSTTGAMPAGSGWQFNATVNTAGVTTPNPSRTTTNDGTGTVNFPLTFPGGTTSAGLTIAEVQQSGFTLQPVSGANAVCTNLSTGQPVSVANSGALGFTVSVPSTQSVNCVVYNRAPSPEADLTVSKTWVVNGTTYADGAQPGGLSAQLRLNGPSGAPASNQGWGVTRSGYTQGDDVTISETVTLIDPTMCTNTARITSINGSSVNIALGSGYVMDLPLAHNTATVTNTVTCESRLTLVKEVANGPAVPSSWQLNAQFLAVPPVNTGLPGFSGASGSGSVTSQPVTPNARYQLFEQGGDARYTQTDERTNLQSNPASTGSATCIRVDANGAPWPASGYSDGINGGVNVPLGFRVTCTLTNQTAQLTLLKHVVNDNGGTATAANWTLVGTPAAFAGLVPVNVTGSETVVPASTFFVRPGHTYTVSEAGGPSGYEQVKLQRLQSGSWVDVAGWTVSVPALGNAVYRVVNDDVAPKLTLVKTVTNDNGGTSPEEAWTLTATTPEGPNLSGTTGSAAVSAQPVEAGAVYTLGESGPGGYDWKTLSCTGYPNTTKAAPTLTLKPGDNVTCTFHNDDRPGTLTLRKVVSNANGGSAVATDWNQKLTAKRGADAALAFDHDETKPVPAGTYTLAEVSQLAGYLLTDLSCSTGGTSLQTPTVSVANGADVICTFTNASQRPKLTLQKLVVNDGGGSATAGQWTLTATNDGNSPIDGTGTPVGGDPLLAAISGQVIAGVPYALAESGPSGYTQAGPWTCVLTGTATQVPVTAGAVTVPLAADVTCRVVNNDIDATGSVAKSAGTPVQQADGTWTIEYTVTVTNGSSSAGYAYVLTDTFQFGGGITVGTPTVIGSPAGVTLTPGWNGGAQSQLATGTVPAGGPAHVYTIRVTGIEIADGTQDGQTWKCQPGETPGAGGFLNRAQIFKPGATVPAGTAYACKEPSFPTISKVGVPAVQNADASWNLAFTITVSNPGAVDVRASLSDVFPPAPAGWSLAGGVWTVAPVGGAPSPIQNSFPPGPGTAWEGVLPAGSSYSFTVSATVAPTVSANEIGDCQSLGGGFRNTATVTSGEIVEDSEGCVSIELPPVTVAKSDGTAAQLANGDWQIDYTVTVSNANDAATVYTLTDAPDLGTGFTIVPAGTGWVGSAPAANTPIEAGGSDEYVYRVIARFDPAAESPELTCVPGQGGAFHNVATVAFPGGSASDSGCAQPAKPAVDKTAAESVQDPDTGLWTLTYEVTVSNPSTIQLAYTLTDVPRALPAGVTGGEWSASGPVAVGGGSGTLDAAWDGDAVTRLATGLIPSGATHTYEVTRIVAVAASVDDKDLDCAVEGSGIWNDTTVTNGIGGNDDAACAEIDRPDVTVKKTVTSTKQLVDGTWEIAYNVVVTNASDALAAVYDLDDTLLFGGDIEIADASWSGPDDDGVFSAPAWSTTLAEDAVVAPDGADTYTVTVHAIVDEAAWDGDTLTCQDGQRPGAGGFLNTALVTVNGRSIPADDCSEPKLPEIEKQGVSALQDPDDASRWTVRYLVTVTSGGYDTFYDLSDTPAFASGIDIVSGSAQLLPDGDPVAVTEGVDFVTDAALPAGATHEYRVSWIVEITDSFSENEADCTGEPGSGFFNTATLTVGDIPQTGEDCIPVEDRVYPVPTKNVTSTSQDPETGQWTIEYELTVTLAENDADLSAAYDLTDELLFGGGIDIESATWSGEGTTDEPFDADGTAVIATDKTIGSGDTHTYTVTVVATVTASAIDEGTTWCYPDASEPDGGFLNTALLTSGGAEVPVDDCSEPVFPEIEKVGGETTDNGDGTYDIEYLVTVSYPMTDAEPQPSPVGYTLTDAPALPAGVELQGSWSAEEFDGDTPAPTDPSWDGTGEWTVVDGGELTPENGVHIYRISATVLVTAAPDGEPGRCLDTESSGIVIWNVGTVTSGEYVADDDGCQVVHFDDVGIEKTSVLPEGEESVEPGDEFDYVLTVTNHGSRPAEDVRITDDDINERLDILSLTVAPAMGWGVAPGFTEHPNVVDLTLDSLGVGESATITIRVAFLPAEPVLVDHDGDPGTPPIIPPVVGDGELPAAPDPVESLENIACVSTSADPVGGARDGEPFAANCDDEEIPTRDITASVYTRCVNDAPFLGWVVTKSASLVDEGIELEWRPDNPDVTPETSPASVVHTQPGGTTTWSKEIAWPGAVFTPSGISIDYPGWRAIRASDIASLTTYFLPGTNTVMTPEQQAQFIFNGLILDPSEIDFAWRGNTEITITVNPTLVFETGYPPATPECFVARHTEVQIEKTASADRIDRGGSFTYDLEVENVSDDSAAAGVVVTDEIPADIRITDVTWPGQGDDAVFPNWTSCEVTGQDGAGYGGTLECVLFGPLQPQGSDNGGATAAPTITLAATASALTPATSIENIGVVDYYTFGDREDTGRDADDATVTMPTLISPEEPEEPGEPGEPLPATGGTVPWTLALFGFVALVLGTTMVVVRRRRGEAKPTL